ncbi:MAG: ATP synthase F1 subunit delta [Pirellulales bacterium]
MTKTPENSQQKQAFDVTVEKLARVYAKAALDAAEVKGTAEKMVEELSELATAVLDRFPQLETLLSTELISPDEKQKILERTFSGRVTVSSLGLLQVLARHDRLFILREVIQSVQSLWEQRSGRVRVEVQFAVEPDPSLQQEVVTALKALLQADPILTTTLNPDLVAGFVVRVGDMVYDGSARTSLERARKTMVARARESIHQQPGQFVQEK